MPAMLSRPRLSRRRLREWLRRYLPAELCGTVTALLAAQLAFMASRSLVVAAVCGSIAETTGYYAAAIARDAIAHYRIHRGRAGRDAGSPVLPACAACWLSSAWPR